MSISCAAKRSKSFGGVLVEAAIVLPILMLLFACLVDSIFLGYTYFALNQIARETALTTIPMSGPQNVNWDGSGTPSESTLNQCYTANYSRYQPTSANCPEWVIKWRLTQLFNTYQLRIKPPSMSAQVSTTGANTVVVSVEAQYKSIFPFFDGTVVRGRAESDHV